MEEGPANTKPSLQQSVRANAAAEPGSEIPNDHAFGEAFRTNHAIRDLTNLQPLPFAQIKLANHVDYDPCSSAHDSIATSGNHTYANPWLTTRPQNDAFASLVNPSPSRLAQSTFPAGAAYNAGIAFPNGPGHYNWAPPVAAGPTDQYANTNFQYLDPLFSVTRPYAAGIIGNGHGGPLQTNGFSAPANAAGAFSNASYAVNNGNSFGGQYAANGFGIQMSAAGAFSNAPYAVNNGNSFRGQYAANGFGNQMSAAGAFSNASYAANNGNSYGGQFPIPGFPTQMMAPNANPSGFHAIDSGNVSGGQLPANEFDTPLMARDAYPSAFRAIDSSHVHGGQFPASGFQIQPSTAIELRNAPPAVDDNAAALGAAHVGPILHTCPECKTAFKRKGELKRHAKKHQADSNVFRCVVAGCGYNSYRKDKLADHVKKHRHAVTATAST